jgi:Glycosyl hydrolases family 15
LHSGVARTRAALALVVVVALAAAVASGGSSSDPSTPPPLPGLPPPFLTTAVLGAGGLTAGVDAYGDIVDLRAPGPADRSLIDNPHDRQAVGTVPASTGIVPLAAVGAASPLPLWRADSIRQGYVQGTNVLRTTARFGSARVTIECAANGGELGCLSRPRGARTAQPTATEPPSPAVTFNRNLISGGDRVHLGDQGARRIVGGATAADRLWAGRARPLGDGAPAWARRMYVRSLLAVRALTDRRSGAVAAGARDGWAHVWPRDAGAVAIALAGAGYRREARGIARFLLDLDLGAAARFDGVGNPVPGRQAQGDAAGWVGVAARAAGLPASSSAGLPTTGARPARGGGAEQRAGAAFGWRNRTDYQEKSPGDYLANALAAADGPKSRAGVDISAHRRELGGFVTRRGLVREAGDPASGLDTAAAWAVRPFPVPALFPAARRTLLALARARSGPDASGRERGSAGRFGLVPSESWGEADPWTAPTAWSAWSLAALAHTDGRACAGRDRGAAIRLLASLRRAATPAGLLPERVDARAGVPRSTAPLAWSHAFAILALRRLWPGRGRPE